MRGKIRAGYRWILILVSFFAMVASLWGVFADSYQDHPWAAAQLKGQDVVTIVISIFLLSTLSVKNRKMSLIRVGLLGYFAYTYITYALGPAINAMFFIYVAIMSLAILGIVVFINQLIDYHYSSRNRSVDTIGAIYLFLIGSMLAVLWIADLIGILSGRPLLQNPTGKPLLTVYVLDLGFIIPLCIFASVQLFRRKQSGILVSGFLLIKSTTLGIALNAMTIALAVYGYAFDWFLAVFWGILGLVGFVLSWLFLSGLSSEPEKHEH